jgi:dihydroorotate dehydrogenase electron transfer subunit
MPRPYTIKAIKTENAATKTFILDGVLEAMPGQFVMVWLPGHEDKPFSLAQADPISLTIAAVGPFSQRLHRLQVGDSLWLRGPLGQGYHLPEAGQIQRKLLLIGGGYGVAPLLFLARQALANSFEVSAIIGARTAASLLLVADFTALGIPPMVTTQDGSAGQPGVVTDALAALLANPAQRPHALYACGPVGMLQAISRVCTRAKIPMQLGWEAHMRCAIGLCGSCEVGQGWLTCLDGPVFPFDPTTR